MRIHPAAQGTTEWLKARLGLPSASQFHRIVTPTGKPSGGRNKYAAELLAEWFYERPASDYESEAMRRGSEEEATAVAWYEWERGVTAEPIGLCLTDDGRAGASPDRLAGEDTCCEFKVPLANTVFLYWLDGRPEEHRVQRQGQLWVTGRRRSDLVIYHPLKSLRRIITDYRDEAFIEAIASEVGTFCDRLDEAKAKLAAEKAAHDQQQSETRRQELEDDPCTLLA